VVVVGEDQGVRAGFELFTVLPWTALAGLRVLYDGSRAGECVGHVVEVMSKDENVYVAVCPADPVGEQIECPTSGHPVGPRVVTEQLLNYVQWCRLVDRTHGGSSHLLDAVSPGRVRAAGRTSEAAPREYCA
jgi:hypothetical protein